MPTAADERREWAGLLVQHPRDVVAQLADELELFGTRRAEHRNDEQLAPRDRHGDVSVVDRQRQDFARKQSLGEVRALEPKHHERRQRHRLVFVDGTRNPEGVAVAVDQRGCDETARDRIREDRRERFEGAHVHGDIMRQYSPSVAPVRVDPKKVREFEDAGAFYAWLSEHAARQDEVWIKIHKARSGKRSITPAEAIDVVLCWGWIDGIRKGFDEHSYLQRYTPRGKTSVWSEINVANV